jgi:hypothetical protein
MRLIDIGNVINDIPYGDNDVKNIKMQPKTKRERRYSVGLREPTTNGLGVGRVLGGGAGMGSRNIRRRAAPEQLE